MSLPSLETRPAARSTTRVGVGILGATGYTGVELVRILAAHPGAALRALGSRQHAGVPMSRVWPALPHVDLGLEAEPDDPRAWVERGVEVVFAALPHGAFAERAAAWVEAGLRVVDLSADFRLRDAGEYERRYGRVHPAPGLLPRAAYGLTEWRRDELLDATLVANPGCYATAVLLAVLPAVAAGWWSGAPIVANALSGVTGAGRGPTLATHFVECGNGAAPYKVGEEHAHLGEMRQAIGRESPAAGAEIVFNPHLVPMARGIVASVAVPLAAPLDLDSARAAYAARYADEPCVQLLDGDLLPETRHVRGSNRCDLAVRVAAGGRLLLVFAALDNLQKGAAGQAVQNWNRMQGWDETTGLSLAGWPCT
jgi:N-acetyl-gamma-glutamyl-phosphate reductase